ncbi:MAG: ABC transporter, partial [Chloroflexi bacterium RBG_16_57_9]
EVTAVDDVSLSIEQGEFVTLLGPSGCGKTTTLRLIAGFEFPTSGQISLAGQVINEVAPNKRDMAMVFQSYAIFPHLSVYENIIYGLKIRRLSEAEIRAKARNVLELTELIGLENRAPNQLSGGQQQRVALARALVMEPKILLFDEPLSNLDARLRVQMREEIRRIQQHLSITSVYVTHDQAEAMTLSDRIVVMDRGRIQQVGTAQDLYQRPASRFVADFIGKANFVEAQVLGVEEGKVEVNVMGRWLRVPDSTMPFVPGERVILIVRPEEVVLGKNTDGFAGIVRRAAYLGSLVEYDVEVNGQLISAVDTDPRQLLLYPRGSEVGVRFLEDCIYVMRDT